MSLPLYIKLYTILYYYIGLLIVSIAASLYCKAIEHSFPLLLFGISKILFNS